MSDKGLVQFLQNDTGPAAIDANHIALVNIGGEINQVDNLGNQTPLAPTGAGDMTKAVYDPQTIEADAFDQDNMTPGVVNANFSIVEQTKLSGIETGAQANVWNTISGDIITQTDLFNYIRQLSQRRLIDPNLPVVAGFRLQNYNAAAAELPTGTYFVRSNAEQWGDDTVTPLVTLNVYKAYAGSQNSSSRLDGDITDDDTDSSFGAYTVFDISFGTCDPKRTIVLRNVILNALVDIVNIGGEMWVYSSDVFTFIVPDVSNLAEIGLVEGSVAEIGDYSKSTIYDAFLTHLSGVGGILNMYVPGSQYYTTQNTALTNVNAYGGQMYGLNHVISISGNSEIFDTLFYGEKLIITGGTTTLVNCSYNGVDAPISASGGTWINRGHIFDDRVALLGANDSQTAIVANKALIDLREQTVNKGAVNGYASLDGAGQVPIAQLPAAVQGGLTVIGTWNADTNVPDLSSLSLDQGEAYMVSVAGSTNLNGETNWKAKDLAVWDDSLAGNWFKLDNTDDVLSVNGLTAAVTIDFTTLEGGTLAELNALVSDANMDDAGDSRTPLAHDTSHEKSGSDEIDVTDLAGLLIDNQKVQVLNDGSAIGSRAAINIIPGLNTSVTIVENVGQNRMDVTIDVTGLHANKSGDTSRADDATPSADPDMVLPLETNSTYMITHSFTVFSESNTPDILMGFTVPAGTTFGLAQTNSRKGSSVSGQGEYFTVSGATSVLTLAANTVAIVKISGLVNTGGTAGNIEFIWSQNTSNATPTIVQGLSFIEATKR